MEDSCRSLVVEEAVGAGTDWHDPLFLPEMIVQDFFVFSPSNGCKRRSIRWNAFYKDPQGPHCINL